MYTCVCVYIYIYHLSDKCAQRDYLMTKHIKDTEKLKSSDIRNIRINKSKIIYRNNNKNRLQSLEAITLKNIFKNLQ